MNVVFAIGCKRYRDPDAAQLKYADQDAKRFVETAMGTQDSDDTEQYLLHDEHENEDFRPTRSNILRFLSLGRNRDKSTELDFLFFYFSGHGWSSQDGTDYLLTSDALVAMPEDTAISVRKLEGHLRNWEAKHVVLFIDACRTVLAGGKGITIEDESRINVDSLCPPGMVTFCSCEPGQTSYEADPICGGVFTEGVRRALGDEGRCSTIQELDAYLNDKVPRISREYGLPPQRPYSRVEPLAVRKALIVAKRTLKGWQGEEQEDPEQIPPETTLKERPLGRYRETVSLLSMDRDLTEQAVQYLRNLANDLNLSQSEASAIEREVMCDTKEVILEQRLSLEKSPITVEHPLRIFCSYSPKDKGHVRTLRDWLRGLEKEGLTEWWHAREIDPEENVPEWQWQEAFEKDLKAADIVLLLITPHFMASNYVSDKEIDRVIRRHGQGEAHVIPIITRPSDWEWASFGKLQAVPIDAKPITTWPNQDEAWLNVVTEIRGAAEQLLRKREKAREQYRKALKHAWTDNEVSKEEAEQLSALASELGLSADTTANIEHEVMGNTQEAILKRQEQATKERVRRERLKKRYDRARKLHQDQDWQAAIDVLKQIGAEDSSYPGQAELLISARKALEAQEMQRRIARIYNRGMGHIDDKEWLQAQRCFEEIQQLKGGYLDTDRLLSQAQREYAKSLVEIPDLSCKKVQEARNILDDKRLELGTYNRASNLTIPEGEIVDQNPGAGMKVEPGTPVSVTVSSGLPSVKVPNLTEQTIFRARKLIDDANLRLKIQRPIKSSTVPEGRIAKQKPAAHTKVRQGSTVTVTVSAGQ